MMSKGSLRDGVTLFDDVRPRAQPDGTWSLVCEYDGEPNGLAHNPDGRVLTTDYRCGLMALDPAPGRVMPLLARRNVESFKGLKDLAIASTGDVYFTDQGQTGPHDPTGRVFRLNTDGRLDCLMENLPIPNGLALSPEEDVLYVAVTRDKAVWRARSGATARSRRWGGSAPSSARADPTASPWHRMGVSSWRMRRSAASSSSRLTESASNASGPAPGRLAPTSPLAALMVGSSSSPSRARPRC